MEVSIVKMIHDSANENKSYTTIQSSIVRSLINKSDNKIIDKLTLYASDPLLAEY